MFLMRVRCCSSQIPRTASQHIYPPARPHRSYSSTVKTDEFGIPLQPSWSVTELLSSYPKPAVSSQTLNRLHDLAALVPPEEGTPEYAKLKEETSELIRLVEAVKLVDTKGVFVMARWDKDDADRRNTELSPKEIPEGQDLLKQAARTHDGFYLVDADRERMLS